METIIDIGIFYPPERLSPLTEAICWDRHFSYLKIPKIPGAK